MKELFLMISEEFGIIDKCLASSLVEASTKFRKIHSFRDWAESDVIAEADYIHDLQLKNFESQNC